MADVPLVKSPVPLSELDGVDVASSGQVPTADGAGGAAWATPSGSGGGALSVIGESVLGSAAASIDFSSIPATFRHLLIEFWGRSTDASTGTGLIIRFNGDTASNYDYQRDLGNGTTALATSAAGTNLPLVGFVVGANATAGRAGAVSIRIPGYASTAFNKLALGVGGSVQGTATSGFLGENSFVNWRSTAAINQVTLSLQSGGNFAAGTIATLYGLATA